MLIDRADHLLDLIETGFRWIAGGLLGSMLAINIAQVTWRAVFDKGFAWVWPWTSVMFVWVVLFAMFLIYRRQKDIQVDFLVRLVGGWAMPATRVLADLLIVVVMSVIVIQGPRLLGSQVGMMELVGLPRYVLSIPLYFSAPLILINALVDLAKTVRGDPEQKHSVELDI